jgi:hypothetical protein
MAVPEDGELFIIFKLRPPSARCCVNRKCNEEFAFSINNYCHFISFEFNAICRAIFRTKALRNSPRVNSKAQPQRATNSVEVRQFGHFRRGTFLPNSIVKLINQIL